jgi:hypothetical protein
VVLGALWRDRLEIRRGYLFETHGSNGGGYVRRERGGDRETAAGRVRDDDAPGVEQMAAGALLAIDAILGDGEADGGEVDADLVGAAGLGMDEEERAFAVIPEEFVFGARFATPRDDGHACAVAGMARDGGLDNGMGAFGDAVADGDVGLVDVTFREGGAEMGLGSGGLGEEEHAGGVLVEAVDDAGVLGFEGAGEGGVVLQEPGGDGGGGVAGGAVDGDARRLVDDEEGFVFVEDGESEARGGGFVLIRR